jgi:hypothetical protein
MNSNEMYSPFIPPLSEKQCSALLEVKHILEDVGLTVPQPQLLLKTISNHLSPPNLLPKHISVPSLSGQISI